ncbi:unnamed protein product [Durusdinium trenchii]|uniref:FAD-binding PCMH-type domain-containing protein n=1 Tax=Durusdinium trenchii TaxID=1381693 RepID=A0ABP0NJC1_9DINO
MEEVQTLQTPNVVPRGPSSQACFPDPDPDPRSSKVQVDDITRMNATEVSRVVYVRTEDDIKRTLVKARADGKRVSVRGTKHSMGGQSIAEDGVVIDMTKMTRMRFDADSEAVVCECGCTWADLIVYLNQFGMSPRTMQSYSSFSVGGTLAVNGHGITTDFTLAECVESLRLIKADGQEVVCSRGATGEEGELFSLALGGYGLFGIMWEVTMRVVRNSRMDMESLHLNCEEFMRHHAAAQASDDVVMKLAQLNIIDTDHIDFFVFRRSHDEEVRLVSNLSKKPREMSWQSKLMYKWLMPAMKEVRYAIEQRSGQALDWGNETERNHMLHESAVPLAQLYEPLFQVDDTFVLQEYFCPQEKFKDWIARTKQIYRALAATSEVILLNTTIRFVKKDVDTFLPYAKGHMFAFVLYFRLPRTPHADACLKDFHNQFVEQTLALDGSFYLPYRCHYSHEQLEQAYPRIKDFFSKKEIYDPDGLFDSLWFRHYGTKYLSEPFLVTLSKPLAAKMPSDAQFDTPELQSIPDVPAVPARRSNAFRQLMDDPRLRRDFKDGFLTQIFNVMDHEQLFRMMVKATRDPENTNDIEIYRALQRLLNESTGPVAAGMKTVKQLKQISAQKKELTREVCAIVARLGKFGQLQDYLSVGDPGRMVLPLRKALQMKGRCWVAHDTYSDDIPAVVERGSLDAVGIQVTWQLLDAGPFIEVPTGSVDLVTMMQGLHHIPQQRLPFFLKEVVRVLRPGGLFIVREHDASPELMPMLDLAHSVFNAVMGVTDKEEERELRAFRSISEWREILKSAGLEDSMLFEMEPYDPTVDEMMCFYKAPLQAASRDPCENTPSKTEEVFEADEISPDLIQLPENLSAFMQGAPQILLQSLRDGIEGLMNTLPAAAAMFKEKMKAFSSGQQLVAQSLVDQAVEPLLAILQKLQPLFQHAEVGQSDSSVFEFIPAEVLLLVPALMRKVQRGTASPNEMFAASIIQDVLNALQGQKKEELKKCSQVMDAAVSKEDVEQLLQLVFQAFPELKKPEVFQTMGFPKRAAEVLRTRLGREIFSDVSSADLAETLSSFLDEEAWVEFQHYLLEAINAQRPPSKDALFNVKTPWGLAMRAFLGSRYVRFNSSVLLMCKFYGLAELPAMWRAAQALRKGMESLEPSGVAAPMLVRSRSDADRMQSVQRALDGLTSKVLEVQMDEGQQHDICEVSEVISATFGYTSLTAKPRDVTAAVRKLLRRRAGRASRVPQEWSQFRGAANKCGQFSLLLK